MVAQLDKYVHVNTACTMGRTVPSFRQLLEAEIERLRQIGKLLSDPWDRRLFADMLEHGRSLENQFLADPSPPFEVICLSMIFDLYKMIEDRDKGTPEATLVFPNTDNKPG